jgi:chorismate mutase
VAADPKTGFAVFFCSKRAAVAPSSRNKEDQMTLNDHRRRIDELDRELVRLLNRRAQMSIRVVQLKKDVSLPMRDEAREESILQHVQRVNPGPLDGDALVAIFRAILAESRRVTTDLIDRQAEKVAE